MFRARLTLGLVLALGCGDDPAPPGEQSGTAASDASTGVSEPGATSEVDPTSTPPRMDVPMPDMGDAPDETGPGPKEDMPPPPVDPPMGHVRFIAMGDGGEGNDSQYAVSTIVEQVCEDRGCDFAIYLGDNFYDVGVDSTMDVQFQDKFEGPYANLDIPFYITLGNHDYGTLGNEWLRSQYQVEYTEFSDKWTLPSEYYTFDAEHVRFISLDTARMFWSNMVPEQAEMVQNALTDMDEPRFTVAFGHHPYISNGEHGNAGNYEGIPIPLVAGESIENFFDDEICGKVTVYFSGHDHNRQWHDPPEDCATHFIVSGAAAKTTDFAHRDDNPDPLYEDDITPGFAWVDIADDTMTIVFYDELGEMNFEDSVTLHVGPQG